MMNKIMEYMFPVGGGTIGAVSQINLFKYFPTWEVCISTVVVAAIGAIVGYLVKLGLDKLFKNDDKPKIELR